MTLIEKIRADFPILHQTVNGHPLVYLDNAATSQKPWQVIESLRHHYEFDNANVHRGNHTLADRSTRGYEGTRDKVQAFIHAKQREEVIFIRGATEGINIIAKCYIEPNLQPGDCVIISELEHHSNIVPWQMLQAKGLEIRWIPVDESGEMEIDKLPNLIDERVKLISVNAISNSLGTTNPVSDIIKQAKAHKIPVLIDACQVPAHQTLDVQALDCDFCVFSSHKMLGPTGIGILYGKRELLEGMPPYLGGGDMIDRVDFDGFSPNDLPYKYEAGTPNIADVVALGAAIDYLQGLDRTAMAKHEQALLDCATQKLLEVPNLRIIGHTTNKTSVISFVLQDSDLHPADLGAMLDQYGIAIRAGHHCTMPLLKKFNVPATARASFAFYNTLEEAEKLGDAMQKIVKRFG